MFFPQKSGLFLKKSAKNIQSVVATVLLNVVLHLQWDIKYI